MILITYARKERCHTMEDTDLGEHIQAYRKQSHISLRELASMAGISPSMLSQIENNAVNPSINTLKSIAEALGVPLYKFFTPREPGPADQIVRKGKHQIIGHWGTDVTYKLLTPDTNGAIEFMLMEFPPDTSTRKEPRGHLGEETAYVIEGPVEVTVDGQSYILEQGDSIRIPPNQPHKWTNHRQVPASVIFAITPPSF